MTDKPLIDSSNFEALAFGVFDNAPDTDTGRASLLQAYDTYNWTDPKVANDTLEYYGQALKYKFQDQSSFGSDIEKIAPVKLTDIPISDNTSEQELFDRWEQANIEYLKTTDEPQYIVARKQLLDDVKDYASEQRRAANERAIKENIGETGAAVVDVSNRFLRGVVSGVEPIINSIANIFTDGYELNSSLTEITNPSTDNTFLSAASEATGSVAGVITAGAAGGAGAVAAYSGVQAVDAVGTRYQETKDKTGVTGTAVKAASVEAISQAVKFGGTQAVFGKLAKGVKIPEEFSIPKAIATEAFSQGAGQYVTNQAEDIQQQTDRGYLTKEAFRNVPTATFLGGALAGAVSKYEATFPSKSNTDIRANEIEQDGFPSTPVTVQKVGPAESTNTDILPAEFVNSDTGEVIKEAAEDVKAIENIPAPSDHAFTTENGTEYFQTAPNQYTKANENPLDQTVFVNENTAKTVNDAIRNGEHVFLNENSEPVIERIDTEGNKKQEPIEHSKEPSVGSFPLSISAERSPAKLEKARLVNPPVTTGQRIKDVVVERSLGAAGQETITQKESQYSQDLRNSALPPGMQKVGEEGIFYTPITLKGVSEEANNFVRDAGIDGAIKAANDPNVDPRLRSGIQTYLHNYFAAQMTDALNSGDNARYERIAEDYKNIVAPVISAGGTLAGQTLVSRRGKSFGDPLPVKQAYDTAYETSLIEQGTEEGIDPLEIGKSAEVVDQTTKAIAQTQQEIERQAAIDSDFVSPEDQAVNEVVAELENVAKEKVDEDVTSIDQEVKNLNESIETTTKKAERTKRKDIQALEGVVAADSESLANALSDARDLKNITAEESAKIEEAINKSLQAAEKKASVEVSKAVKEERKLRETEKKSRLEKAQERIDKAETALADRKAASAEQLKKLKLKERDLLKTGEDTAVITTRIKAIEDRLTNAAQRVIDAKEAHRQLQEELTAQTEAAQQAEDLLNELESGIEVRVSPVGKKRAISVRTKRSGLDVTKLFNTKSEAYGPLSALSRSVNELAGTVRQSLGAKTVNNERINELQKRINENKAALEKTRTRDALSDKEKARVAAAKKRLAELERAKTEATVESRIPKKDREKYKKFKERQATQTKGRQSPELKAAKEKLKTLEAEKTKAEKLLKRREKAKQKALEAARNESENQKRIGELKEILANNENLSPSAKKDIEAQIAARSAANEDLEVKRDNAYRLWVAAQIGSMTGIAVGTISSAVVSPFSKSFGLAIPTVKALLKNIASGSLTKYKYPLLSYWAGLTNAEARTRGLELAGIAARTGERLENIIPRKELVARSSLRGAPVQYQDIVKDYTNFTKSLKFKDFNLKNTIANAAILAQKVAGRTSGYFLRALAATEALTYSIHDSGFDRAAAAYYYNKGLDEKLSEAELAKYKYSPKENWKKAQVEAAAQAKTLRDNGIEFSPTQERISAVELYQSMRPREIQVSAFKNAAQVVLNSPAAGLTGLFSDQLQKLVRDLQGTPLAPIKYLTPFANSIANQLGMAVDLTPFGLIGLSEKANAKLNRTSFERSMMISSAITGTTTAMALALYAIKQLELPEDQRPFDIIGSYSSDKKKRDAFTQAGGLLYSIRIGNRYIPFSETPFVLLLGGAASAVDQVRNKKIPVPENATSFTQAAFSMAQGTLGGIGNLSMLRGITDMYDALKDLTADTEGAEIKIARTLMNTVKGFTPGASILRNIARYTDNPVDAKKDITSALVEGFPGLQSAFGKPALNIFGEPMKAGKDDETTKLHRIFSSRAADLDIRWLTDNGYTVPNIPNMRFSKQLQQYVEAGDEENAQQLDYNLKHEVFKESANELRDLVAQYRQRFGSSAFRPEIQKALNKDFNRILAKHSARIVTK